MREYNFAGVERQEGKILYKGLKAAIACYTNQP